MKNIKKLAVQEVKSIKSMSVKPNNAKGKNLECQECLFKTFILTYINCHVRLIHTPGADPSYIISFKLCEFLTLYIIAMTKHVKSKHNQITHFYCSMFDFKAFHRHHVLQHIKSTHRTAKAEVKSLKCADYQSNTEYLICNWLQREQTRQKCSHVNCEYTSAKKIHTNS